MHFKLEDGKPIWAIAKVVVEEEYPTRDRDENRDRIIEMRENTIYLYDEDDLAQHPEAIPVDPPTSEIITRAAQLEGKTLSKSEFERMLFEEPKISEIDILGSQLVNKDIQIMQLENDNNILGQRLVDLEIRLMVGGL